MMHERLRLIAAGVRFTASNLDYALRRPYGIDGTGRTLPPHMNAATFGRVIGWKPPRITIPGASAGFFALVAGTFFPSMFRPPLHPAGRRRTLPLLGLCPAAVLAGRFLLHGVDHNRGNEHNCI